VIGLPQEELVNWIKDKMTVDEMSVLETNKEIISKFIGITKDGKSILLVDKAKLNGQQMIVLYLIGKFMSKLAGYANQANTKNIEIAGSLGIPPGTVGRCLRELENAGTISRSEKGGYEIILSSLPTFLSTLRGV